MDAEETTTSHIEELPFLLQKKETLHSPKKTCSQSTLASQIVRDYFPYITETETTTFTDCVKCLITFTSSKFSSDASLNAIAFLRFCAVKLAEEGFSTDPEVTKDNKSHVTETNGILSKDDHVYFWVPLLDGMLSFYFILLFFFLV